MSHQLCLFMVLICAVAGDGEKFDVTFRNELSYDVRLYWMNVGSGKEHPMGLIPAGGESLIGTYATHKFMFYPEAEARQEQFRKDITLNVVTMEDGVSSVSFPLEGDGSSEGECQVPDVHEPIVEKATNPRNAAGKTESEDVLFDGACEDRHERCPRIANPKSCLENPGWMSVMCAKSCNSCDLINPKVRCDPKRLNLTQTPGFEPGEMSTMFKAISEQFQQYKPVVYSEDPWIVVLDEFLTDEEVDALIETTGPFERSTDSGTYNPKTGITGKLTSQSRTSSNAWCRERCLKNGYVQSVIAKIENVTTVPSENYESFQVLQYEPGQYYRRHHDYGKRQSELICGPRILTFFLYLSDVEEGGETKFSDIGISVKAKKGRALIWPSVLDSDLNEQEGKTYHEARPVIKGLKYAANAWIHLHNFDKPNKWGCTGAFD